MQRVNWHSKQPSSPVTTRLIYAPLYSYSASVCTIQPFHFFTLGYMGMTYSCHLIDTYVVGDLYPFFFGGPFYKHRITLIPTWIWNHIPSYVWNEITSPFPNFRCLGMDKQFHTTLKSLRPLEHGQEQETLPKWITPFRRTIRVRRGKSVRFTDSPDSTTTVCGLSADSPENVLGFNREWCGMPWNVRVVARQCGHI